MCKPARSRFIPALLLTIAAACSSNRGRTVDPAASPGSAPARTAEDESQPGPLAGPSSDEPLPKLARSVLQDPMRRHGDNLESLLWTALMLDYDSTAMIASWIVEEPRLSRPGTQTDALNVELPPHFFQLQDELHRGARDLAQAARKHDDAAMADAFSRLAGTCIRCHSAYLHTSPLPEE
jgi:hypothetical protein